MSAAADREWLKPHQWKKGQTGNPAGRPKGSPGARVRKLGNQFVAEVFEKIFIIPEDEMNAWMDENLKHMSRAEKIFLNHSTDLKHLNSLLDRVIGIPTKVEFKEEDDEGIPVQFNIIKHKKHD